MIFYHFTCREHLASIERDGRIAVTESNIGSPSRDWLPYGSHVGPPVVWLLDVPEPDRFGHGLTGSVYDKTAVRITVDVPAIRWLDWLPAAAMHPVWMHKLIDAGGGPEAAAHWYVWPAPIRRSRWLSVDVLKKAETP